MIHFKSTKSMKKFRLISFILVITLAAGLFVGCGKKSTYEDNQVVWIVNSSEGTDTPRVLKQFNEMLKEKTGYEVVFKYISSDQYDLQFSGGDSFDLVPAQDYMGYWANVEKGAFMPLTEEDFKTNAPYIWENGKKFIDAGKFEGKYYAIPGMKEYSPDRVLMARGDLMDKYGIEALNTIDDIDKFVMAIANDKSSSKELLAFNVAGRTPWMIFNLWASDWGWGGVGTLSFGEHIYYDTDDDYPELFIAIDKPEVREYSNQVHNWYNAGVFSKSVLSNETPVDEAFKNGKSALAWASNPENANLILKEMYKDERKKDWDVRFYSMYSRQQRMYNFMNSACAISAKSKKKEQALAVVNAIYSDPELYKLLQWGIEGEHYEINENGFNLLDTEGKYMAPGIGIDSTAYNVKPTYIYDYAEELAAELKGKSLDDPLVNCPVITSNDISIIQTQLKEVFAEYCYARMYGAVDNVDKAIKNERAALKAAGIDAFLKHTQKCVDDYVKNFPESMERYEASKKKVAKWNKEHPTKTAVR